MRGLLQLALARSRHRLCFRTHPDTEKRVQRLLDLMEDRPSPKQLVPQMPPLHLERPLRPVGKPQWRVMGLRY